MILLWPNLQCQRSHQNESKTVLASLQDRPVDHPARSKTGSSKRGRETAHALRESSKELRLQREGTGDERDAMKPQRAIGSPRK